MSVLNQSGEEQVECPLCMEPLEVDDLNFYPCTCGYQICRFCWHRIRTDENGLCPACRKAYSENPADFTPLSKEQVAQLKAEKRQRDQQRKAKLSESRKHLASVRVVQKNLVFVVGLPVRLADSDVLKRHEYFGKFGKIHKVVINQSTSYAGSQGPSASAYVTYVKSDDALRAIQNVNNITLDGRLIKSSLGTTKYCSHFMKNQPCPKADCMYLHDFGDPEASFTKEQMHMGKHQEYEKKLHDALVSRTAAQAQQQQAAQLQQQQGNQQQQQVSASNGSAVAAAGGDKGSGSGAGTHETRGKHGGGGGSGGGGGQKDSNWPTLSTSDSSSSNGFNSSNKTEKQQKSESRSEKSQKKNNSQKNKNNNNTSNTNNNIENSKKSEKQSSKNCEQNSCNQQPQQQHQTTTQTSTQQPVVSTQQQQTVATQSTTTTSTTTHQKQQTIDKSTTAKNAAKEDILTTASECIDSLSKIQLLDDNSSFFSHNTFQKILPDQDSSSYSTDSSSLTPHSSILNDNLPDINSTEDWQAAFGFAIKSESSLSPTNSLLKNSSNRNSVVSENGLGGFRSSTDFTSRQEDGFVKLEQPYSALNHIENYQKPQQNGYDTLKSRESILDLLAGRNSHYMSGNSHSFKHIDQPNDRTNHCSPFSNLNQQKLPENGLNGLDQQMSKFFAEFNKNNQKDIVYNGFNHQNSNGFVQNIGGDRQNFISNQVNLSDSPHNMLLISQYQQRILDKHLEEQQALYNLKQNAFHSQQQPQQQFVHNHGTPMHHSGSQQFLANGGDHFLSQNGQGFGNSGFSQNSVFQNQTLQQQQQRNQGQHRDRPSVDDDLGFDPFHETQKALAELIESEQGVSQMQNTGLLSQGGLSGHNTNGSSGSGPVNGLLHGGNAPSSGPGGCLPPPPGFMQHSAHMNSFGSKILPFLNMSNNQQNTGGWSSNYSEGHAKGLAPVNDWMTLDPAIVSSSRHFPLASLQPLRDQYNSFQQPPQQQQQQTGPMRGYDFNQPQTNGLTNGYTTSSSYGPSQQQQTQQHTSHNLQSYANTYSQLLNSQPNGLNWYGGDLHGQISSPPGFRQTAATAAAQSKTQEC